MQTFKTVSLAVAALLLGMFAGSPRAQNSVVGPIGQQLVTLIDTTGVPVAVGGGTQYTEGDVDASISGTAVMLEAAGNVLATWATTVLADNMANPTVPGVAAYTMCFDGSTWDRCAGGGAGGTQYTEGDVDASITGTAVILEAAGNTAATWLTTVMADNMANPTVPGVAAYQMCFDGSTWDRCSTTQLVDTELPAIAALADNTANPTLPAVAAFSMCFDGATWDRCTGGGGGIQYTEGDTDATITGTAILLEAASNTLATWLTTVMADNMSNPTVPGVAAYSMCFDGATWDRCTTADGGVGTASSNTTRIVQSQQTIFRSIDLDESEEEIKGTAGELCSVWVSNNATSTAYLKFYNATAANVTAGTSTPVITIPLPGSAGGDDIAGSFPLTNGCLTFGTAITAAVTTGVADADTGAPAANQAVVMFGYR